MPPGVDAELIGLTKHAQTLRLEGRWPEFLNVLGEVENRLDRLPDREQEPLLQCAVRIEQSHAARYANDVARAKALLVEAERAAARSDAPDVALSDVFSAFSELYLVGGGLGDASTAAQRALDYARRSSDPLAISNALNQLALVYDRLGDRATARSQLTEAMRLAFDYDLHDAGLNTAFRMIELAHDAGELDDADQAFERLRVMYRDAGRQPMLAGVLARRGLEASRRRDYPLAADILARARAAHVESGSAADAVDDLIRLAQVESAMGGRDDLAYAHASEAHEEAVRLGLLPLQWLAAMTIGRVRWGMLAEGSNDQARVDALVHDILPSYASAAELLELLRGSIGQADQRQLFFSDREELYEDAVGWCVWLERFDDAFTWIERSRARSFLDGVGQARLAASSVGTPLTRQREQATLALLKLNVPGRARVDAGGVLDDLRRLRARIAAETPRLSALTEVDLPRIESIAACLMDDSAVVGFMLDRDARLTTYVLKSDGVATVVQPDLDGVDLVRAVQRFRAEVQHEVAGEPTGKVLFQALLAPVLPHLANVQRLYIVPHRELHQLPFASMWFELEGQRHYLQEYFVTSVLPAAAYLPICQGMPARRISAGQALVLGDPTADLPGAEREALMVASLLQTSPLLGAAATRQAVLDGASGQAVVHIASHGEFNRWDPLLSGVRLADTLLTVEDLLQCRLDAGLVVFSGCVTGLAERLPGDELIGLARAAAFAGVPSVITTLWETWDRSSAAFFEAFYASLLDDAPVASALQQAQTHLRTHTEWRNPVHWAGYVLLGEQS